MLTRVEKSDEIIFAKKSCNKSRKNDEIIFEKHVCAHPARLIMHWAKCTAKNPLTPCSSRQPFEQVWSCASQISANHLHWHLLAITFLFFCNCQKFLLPPPLSPPPLLLPLPLSLLVGYIVVICFINLVAWSKLLHYAIDNVVVYFMPHVFAN